jgi:pyruvate kinase
MVRTKILATIGPASFDKIGKLIEAGADGIRFNMAHIKVEDYPKIAGLVKAARQIKPELFVTGDLEGPKLRLGEFEPLSVKIGDKIDIVPARSYSGRGVPIKYDEFYKHVQPGRLLLIDDGKVGLRINNISGEDVNCTVEYGEILQARKGVNTPGMAIPMEYMTEKMRSDSVFLKDNGFDYVFASFSRKVRDMLDVKKAVDYKVLDGGKVEDYEGDENLDSIVEISNAMMVPRGDYGMEMGVMKVPAYQKSLIERCNIKGIPVFVATQMLESMMTCKEPSRAEVSDIFNAVLDGTDVVMLSGETSKGNYPVEAVRMMNSILEEAERYLFDKRNGTNLSEKLERLIKSNNPADVVSRAVYEASKADSIKAIVIPTNSGYTARMIARFRGEKPIIAVTYNDSTRSRLNAIWGVTPLIMERCDNRDLIIDGAIVTARSAGYVKNGENVIVTSGMAGGITGSTSMMQIRRVD